MAMDFGNGMKLYFFRLKTILIVSILVLITGCSPTYRNHGYVPSVTELNQLKVGKSSKENVKNLFGSPSSIGLVQEDRWFYLYTKIKNFMYRSPEIIERQLVVVTFGSNGLLENIEKFELQDQEVVVLSRRITKSGIKGMSLIQQLLNSAGNYDPAQAFEK